MLSIVKSKRYYTLFLIFHMTGVCIFCSKVKAEKHRPTMPGTPILFQKVNIPDALLKHQIVEGKQLKFGGDIRIGDLSGNNHADFLVYRSVDNAHDGGGLKPCFMAAFNMEGDILWQTGNDGEQPSRPGPVAIYDIDQDGQSEIICFFIDPNSISSPDSMGNVFIQIRDGKTGKVEKQSAPKTFRKASGKGPNWVHQRILIANLRGHAKPQDFIVKLGSQVFAFTENLQILWIYDIPWNDYGKCSAYIPSIGDIDQDGKDEINGGYYLLDDDGRVFWEKQLGDHMDSVTITEWDNQRKRAFCSGFGHVMSVDGSIILRLGEEKVPHGQELRVAKFLQHTDPFMIIRYLGHQPDIMVVNTEGHIVNKFKLNPSPNNTGMEVVYWNAPDSTALLYNGGFLWDPAQQRNSHLPGLPEPIGPIKMGWYHCIPANICGDNREEVVLYNPWDQHIYVYTPLPLYENRYQGYIPGPRQYNARLMD